MENKKALGHVLAIFTIFIWGTTFISTKILLQAFQPVEILFFRFVADKKLETGTDICRGRAYRNDLVLFNGKYRTDLFTGIECRSHRFNRTGIYRNYSTHFLKRRRKTSTSIFHGVIALIGISLISFSGTTMHLNPIGDLLSVGGAIIWSFYSVLSKKIGSFGYSVVQATRRTFFYGILFMIPALFIFDFKWNLTRFATPAYLFNIFYLGLGASAICFVTWNMAVRILGAIKTSVYIYLAPVVTAVTSVIILHEKITFLSGLGILLVLGGLLLSEQKKKFFSIRGRKQAENVIE